MRKPLARRSPNSGSRSCGGSVRAVFASVILAVTFVAGANVSRLCAAEPPAKKPQPKTILVLKGKSIIFNRATGDIKLEGDVHVTRTVGDERLTVDCDKMTATMKDEKLENVLARGNVSLAMKDLDATASRASFDFTRNIIVLYGEEGRSANAKSARIESTGPKIIFHLDDQRVELPNGGVSKIILGSDPGEKKGGK